MKLQNKKTGQIGNFIINKDHFECVDLEYVPEYRNLAELNEEWEDAEEPKEYWYIDDAGVIQIDKVLCSEINMRKSIGNYFETREEAEKVVKKLEVWKRLKDKGISFKAKVIDRKWYLEPKAEPKERTFDEAESLMDDVMFIFGVEE